MKQAVKSSLKPMPQPHAKAEQPHKRHRRRHRAWWKTFLYVVVSLAAVYLAVLVVVAMQPGGR